MKWQSYLRSIALSGVVVPSALMTGGAAMPAWGADAEQVIIKDFMFSPLSITVKTGATVSWINKDDEPHTVVSDAGVFRSSGLDTNESFSYKFDKAGTYRIVCSIHPRMMATVVVQ